MLGGKTARFRGKKVNKMLFNFMQLLINAFESGHSSFIFGPIFGLI